MPYVGSYMLSMRFAARLLHPFEDGVHCGYFTTAAELDRQVGLALEDPDGTELIAANGREHALRHHTVDARIRYVLDKVVVG